MKSAYQIIRRPVITEKGLAIKENQNTLVFQVRRASDQDRNQTGRAVHLQGEGAVRAHRQLSGQRAPPGKVRRLSSGLEEGIRTAEVGRKDAGVRAELVVSQSVGHSVVQEGWRDLARRLTTDD